MARGKPALGKPDWLSAALDALVAGGPQAVKVERLARGLGVTKGSFYWHFANRHELLLAALDLWERVATDQVIASLDAADSAPADRITALMHEALSGEGLPIERALLSAAATHTETGAVYARVSARRLAYVERLFRDHGLDGDEARDAATSLYAEFVGIVQLAPLHPAWLERDGIARRVARALRRTP